MQTHFLYRTSNDRRLPPYAKAKLVVYLKDTVVAGEQFAVVRDYLTGGEFLIRRWHLLKH
jgi:hypothetical protein